MGIRKCKICGKEFETYNNKARTKSRVYKRSMASVTCSPKCSRDYTNKAHKKKKALRGEMKNVVPMILIFILSFFVTKFFFFGNG